MLGIGVRMASNTRSGMIEGPGMATRARPKRNDIDQTLVLFSPKASAANADPTGEGQVIANQAA